MRVAIIGTGGIARVHVRLIRELDGELVAVCGRTSDSARSFATAPAYDDVTRMLHEQKPDVVHVCSPNHLHAAHSVAAFEAGAHVLCEKPMATNTDECRRMIDAATKAGRVGAVAYTYRGYPLVEILRRKVANGDFGMLRRVGGCYLSQDVLPADKYVWLFTPGTTGRSYALMDLGIHWLDLVEYVTGARIHEITAQFSTHQRERIWRGGAGEGPRPPGCPADDGGISVAATLEEQADLLIRLDNGAAGSLTVSGLAPGHPNTIVLSADGATERFRLEPAGSQHVYPPHDRRQHDRTAQAGGFATKTALGCRRCRPGMPKATSMHSAMWCIASGLPCRAMPCASLHSPTEHAACGWSRRQSKAPPMGGR